ncbi:MAG TPA: MauE/DoxX family redox-associated membrane protein [Candidatus Latescibacteria bacterium]|nr:MauE/DoxX family redox-associated membrane protein [Candidatus Latescibacterota bacterium]
MIKNKTLLVVFRLILGGLFVYAGVVKVLDPLDFAQNIRNYRLVGQSLSFIVAVVLPWLEILAGVALAAGIWKRASALIISGLLVFFILLTLVTIARGLDVECGCFGALSRRSGFGVVLEDLGMLFMGLCLLFAPERRD